jgi:hypothetical protein
MGILYRKRTTSPRRADGKFGKDPAPVVSEASTTPQPVKVAPPPPEPKIPPGYLWVNGQMWKQPSAEEIRQDQRARRRTQNPPMNPWTGR